jgi:hypothetical protein
MNGSYRRVTSAPKDDDRQRCQIYAYVGDGALSGKSVVNIHCNCGGVVSYDTATLTNVSTCQNCGLTIGIMGVTGGPGRIPIKNADGSTGSVPIQGFD